MAPRALFRFMAALVLAAAPAMAAEVQRQTADAISFVLVEDAEKEFGAAVGEFLESLDADPAARGWLRAGDDVDPAGLIDPLARILRLPELRGWGCQRAQMSLPDWPHVRGGPWEYGSQARMVLDCGPEEQLCFDLYFVLGGVEGTQYGVEIQRMDEAQAARYLRAARPIPSNCVGA